VERDIGTSVSLMVRWPAAAEASAYARRVPGLSAGLHVKLGEWTCHQGTWRSLYNVVAVDDSRRRRPGDRPRNFDSGRLLAGLINQAASRD
jgi:hypothetical protein